MARRVTLVAGSGALVPHIAQAVTQRGDALQIVDLAGRESFPVATHEVVRHSLSDAASMLASIKAFRPSHLVLAGAVHISDADRIGIAKAFGTAGKVAGSLGDIGLAGMILLYCKTQGYRLVGAHDVAPELVTPEGHIAGPRVDGAVADLAAGAVKAARTIGGLDLGQAIVVSANRPVAAEDAGGTDALLTRVKELRAQGLVQGTLVLAKARKPKQPAFVDLPAIGTDTIVRCAEAGISVIAMEAKVSLLLDRAGIEREAAARGITVMGVRHG